MKPIHLGPFALEAPLAAGGMGEVWLATHVGQGLPVAVKVVTSKQGRSPGVRRALAREVRAMAGISHPHIVVVLDQLEVSEEAAEALRGKLVAGSPAVVMELGAGTLAEVGSDSGAWRPSRS